MNSRTSKNLVHVLEDTKQSVFDLSVIQLALIANLPLFSVSILMLTQYGFTNAIITLILGNILLYFIRYGIISLCKGTRENTLELARRFVGYIGGFIIALIMLASTLAWFVEQTSVATEALTFLIPIDEGPYISPLIQWSVYMGGLSTTLCMEGIVWLRRAATIAFPILLGSLILLIFFTPSPQISTQYISTGFSLAGLPILLGTSLGISADLPTFFRHSATWKNARRSILWIQIISLLIGILALYLVNILSPNFGSIEHAAASNLSLFSRVLLIILVICGATMANIANIYAASVAWELVAPVLAGRKEYLILGLGLTSIFIIMTGVCSLEPMITLTDNGLINLSLILIFGYFLICKKKKKNKEIKNYDKFTLFLAWLLATAVNTLSYYKWIKLPFMSLISALVVIAATLIFMYSLKAIGLFKRSSKPSSS